MSKKLKSYVCEECGQVLKGHLAYASHMKKHRREDEVEVKEVKKEASKEDNPNVVFLKSICKNSLHDKDTKRMFDLVASQPFGQIFVPREKGEKKGATESFSINGLVFVIEKGQMVMLPQALIELLQESYNINASVGEAFKITGDQPGGKRINE